MIEHMVWARFLPETTSADEQEIMRLIRGLKDEIPEVIDIKAGAVYGSNMQGYTHGWTVTVAGPAELEAYMSHPAHQRVGPRVLAAAELTKLEIEVLREDES